MTSNQDGKVRVFDPKQQKQAVLQLGNDRFLVKVQVPYVTGEDRAIARMTNTTSQSQDPILDKPMLERIWNFGPFWGPD